MKVFNVLIINQKGGVGKTTIAEELAFAIERKGKSVAFVTTDAQGGIVHESTPDNDADYQIVDTAGVLTGDFKDWCRHADMIIIPVTPSGRDLEPTMRTHEIAIESKTKAQIGFVINEFSARGVLDRQLEDFLADEDYLIWKKIPKAVGLAQAPSHGMGLADYDKNSPVIEVFDEFADLVIEERDRASGAFLRKTRDEATAASKALEASKKAD